MHKERRLQCTIHESETENMFLVKSTLVDGTPFEIKTPVTDVVFKTKSKELPAEGFLKVMEYGIQGDRATIVLPAPSIVHGKNVCVSKDLLL